MDSFNIHSIKMEKANAKLRHRRIQKITAMFRLVEFCIFLIIVSRFTTQLPVAFKLSGEYFRGFSFSGVSPRFVFILGNAIVIVLFLKSGHLSAKDGSSGKTDFYDEYVKNCENNRSAAYKEESTSTKKQRKQSSSSSSSTAAANFDAYNCHIDDIKERKVKIQRSQSEKMKRKQPEESSRRELKRAVTVSYRGFVDNEEKPSPVSSYKEDEMSSEEFKRTVEDFIARQQRALREE